jgi:hypothetical protein
VSIQTTSDRAVGLEIKWTPASAAEGPRRLLQAAVTSPHEIRVRKLKRRNTHMGYLFPGRMPVHGCREVDLTMVRAATHRRCVRESAIKRLSAINNSIILEIWNQ